MANNMPIPTDWVESEQGYALYVVCGPNSDMWRRNVKGALYALTRGRNYDFDTGIFKDIEQLANDMDDSFMTVCMNELIQRFDDLIITQRMIVAALMGQSINFESEGLPSAVNFEQGIRQAILSIKGAIDTDLTLAETIALMETNNDEEYNFKDWLEILNLLQDLFPGIGGMSLGSVSSLWKSISQARITHNTLTLQAYQATSLRGIQNAISPVKDENEEESNVASILETLDKIPWLTTAIVALVDPSPAGESAIAVKIALTAKSLVSWALGWIPNWYNQYINSVGNPQPVASVTGMLAEISRKIQSLDDETETPTVTVSNRLKAISDALEGLEGKNLEPVLDAIENILGGSWEPMEEE